MTEPQLASPVAASGALIEAVPNFSEGRDPAVIAALVQAIQAPGVLLLDQSSDRDHNRTVITVAGAPEAVIEGLVRAVRVAAQQIDLTRQRGVHPRLGATDVVPLVPLRNISLADCAAWAHALGRRIGDEVGLPVYFYEAAALRPARRNLADVRRGEYEQLRAKIHLPTRAPDFGPAEIGPAGAVIVGARGFLVAYNLFLQSGDVAVARRIARAIRQSNGGLPGVKAMGLLVNGRAQVSMNLVDFRQTPLHVVVDTVSRLAQAEGVGVVHAELIGLLPQEVVFQAAAQALKLPELTAHAVVESAVQLALDAQNRTVAQALEDTGA